MERRKLLQLLGASTTVGIGISTLQKAISASEGISHWGYIGAGSPENWGDLSASYSACRAGLQQSPINLHNSVNATLATLDIRYQPIPLTILNNGHTIQVNSSADNLIQLDGKEFKLLQFHFHHPSEHTVEDEPFPMEMHFVHANAREELAVLGIFLREGTENTVLRSVWKAMPSKKTAATIVPDEQVDIAQLLPRDRSTFRFFGSLTTPPCSEIVKWIIFQDPIEVSSAQVEQFRDIFPLNARPTQPLNRRFLLTST